MIYRKGEIKLKKNKWVIIIVVLSILGTALIYPYLPEQVPAHWNLQGEIDRYQAKSSVFKMALLPLGLYLLMMYLPMIDPKKGSYEKHKNAYNLVQILVVLLLTVLHWISMLVALDFDIDVGFVVRILVGLMFIVIGNYSSQIRQNYFFGIKTPWTLANEQVWRKTQRIGGYSFIIMGAMMILSIWLPPKFAGIVILGSIFGGVGFVYIYSYLCYKKLQ